MSDYVLHAGATDVGQRRDHNEDAILDDPPLFAVADGVGGAAKGEVASATALEVFEQAAGSVHSAPDADSARHAMVEAVLRCNAAVHAAQAARPERAGMATTLTGAALRQNGEVVLGHVGDSRAYAIAAGGVVRQLTEDHSLVGELVRAGQMSPADAAEHPHRNVITRALGPEADVQVDASVVQLRPGEWLLLCSDGLTGHVQDAELGHTVLDAASPEVAVRELVALANERGGSDNISVVLVQPLPPDEDTATLAAAAAVAGGEEHPARSVELSGELDVVPIELTSEHETSGARHDPSAEGTTQTIQAVPATPPRMPPVRRPGARTGGPAHNAANGEPPLTHAAEWPQPRPRARYLKRILFALFILLVAFVAGGVAWRQSYFLTEQRGGLVGIDQGFPIFGLSRDYQTSDVHVDDLEPGDRERYVATQTLRSREDAERIYDRLPELAGRCERQTAGGGSPADATTLRDPNC